MDIRSNWQRARDIFDRAISAAPADRADVLARECDGNETLRREVEQLLTHHQRVDDGFLRVDGPKVAPPDAGSDELAAWAQSQVGARIGRYELTRVIGSGGMGCVFEAAQESPRRRVALKVLRPGLASASALARFRLEPEVLARLHHVHIAQVFEAGVHPGVVGPVPFFAMELIQDARTLVEYAHEQRLSIRQRIELFIAVCDAVQHGHQKGVIHRDLKPGNILVGADGTPKIIDFGVARATDADMLIATQCTRAGDLIGTPRYMSPEQCDGDQAGIDTRTDIYSLGVVLYELLTGHAPYDTSGTFYATVKAIKESPPRAPSEGNRSLRGNIDAILLKALEKDPARRYASASGLAQDLRRHLSGEPIAARPPSVVSRVLGWAARRPVLATALACFVIAAVSLLATSVSLWWALQKPARVVLLDEREDNHGEFQRAELRTPIGKMLMDWGPVDPDSKGLRYGQLRKDRQGRSVAILGGTWDRDRPFRSTLGAFSADLWFKDRPTKVWEGVVADGEIPEELPPIRKRGSQYHLSLAEEHDIFPEHLSPGNEIVCVFGNENSQRSLRIYNVDGEVLYEFWHDGDITQLVWLAKPGLLILGDEHQQIFWNRERKGLGSSSDLARVAFAMKPQLGKRRADRFIPLEADGTASDQFVPKWYLTPLCDGKRVPGRIEISLPPSDETNSALIINYQFLDGIKLSRMSLAIDCEVTEAGLVATDHRANGNLYINRSLPEDDPQRRPEICGYERLEFRSFLEEYRDEYLAFKRSHATTQPASAPTTP